MRAGAVLSAAAVLLCLLEIGSGFQQPEGSKYLKAPKWRAIRVQTEEQLRFALTNRALGWGDRRVIQLDNDLVLESTVTVDGPVRIEGNCQAAAGRRCTLRASRPIPLIHVTGPAALVQLGNLRLTAGQADAHMGGALTAANSSLVELFSCVLTGNSAKFGGGGLLVDGNAHVTLVDTKISKNEAGERGGGVHIASGTLHLDRSIVSANSAPAGGGICVGGGAAVTAVNSEVRGNLLAKKKAGKESNDEAELGADILLEHSAVVGKDGEEAAVAALAEAFFQPVPSKGSLSVSGGALQDLDDFNGHLPGDAAPAAEFGFQGPRDRLAAATAAAVKRAGVGGRRGGSGIGVIPVSSASSENDAAVALEEGDAGDEGAWQHFAPMDLPPGVASTRRGLKQQGQIPPGARIVNVTSEAELASAIRNKERFINLLGHITLSGAFAGDKSLLPSIKASLTINADCPTPYDGKCLIKAGNIGAIMYADNTGFLPGMEIWFRNIIFQNGKTALSGGAISNAGAMAATFENCDFVGNQAGQGGAVGLVEGAFGVFTDCSFRNNAAATDGSGPGTGGAVLLTGQAGFIGCSFSNNKGQNGGAVGVGGSSNGISFDGCTFASNDAVIFGNDVYMESWVATVAYFNPFPTTAEVYTNPNSIQPMSVMPPMYYPAAVTSPPPSPPTPPSPPPPAPPSPPNPKLYIYNEDQLWDALNYGNTTITLGAHIQFSKQGRWALAPPPPVISEVRIISRCEGYGKMCIIDMANSRFPLLDVQSGAIVKMYNVRVINGATVQDGGAVRLSQPRKVLFEACEFIGNYAGSGGAVSIKGGSDITFKDCNFGMNWADATGGAVYMVGSSTFFVGCSFYFNTAASGGAIGMGPASKAFLIDANFTRNVATKWGPDIFLSTPVGSTIYMQQWPPESVARIFPAQANVMNYFAPPPAPPSPPSPPPAFKRAPYPPPGPLPPGRVNAPPPSPPAPPPFPPPRPPSPPFDGYQFAPPIMWAPIYLAVLLAIMLIAIIYVAVHHKKFLTRVRNPEELRARLTGEWETSSVEEDFSVGDAPGIEALEPEEEEVVSGVMAAVAAPHRRRQTAAGEMSEAQRGADARSAAGQPSRRAKRQ